MNDCENYSLQILMLQDWIDAAPFKCYRGWLIRSISDAPGYAWDLVEPPELGGGIFESSHVYSTRSKALLEARKFILQRSVSLALSQVLAEFLTDNYLSYQEYQALSDSTQSDSLTSIFNHIS